MTTDYDLFLSKYNDKDSRLDMPNVSPTESFEYTVLFGFIFPNIITNKFVDYVYQCFKHLDFFVEFYFLTVDGLHRNNFGEMHNIIHKFQFFKNQHDFKNHFLKLEDKFSINIVFTIENLTMENVYCCNLTQKDWLDNLQKAVNDKFKQY